MKISRWIGTGILLSLVGVGITVIASTQVDFDQEIKRTFMDPTLMEKTYELSEVKNINFSGSVEMLRISYSEDKNLLSYYEGKYISYDIEYDEETASLSIIQNYRKHFSFSLEDTAILYLNKDLESLSLDVSAGNVRLENLQINQLDAKLSAGNLELKDIVSNSAKLEASAGNVNIKDSSFSSIYMRLSAGNLTFFGDIYEYGDIEVTVGNMTLNLNREKDQYTINGIGTASTSIVYDVSLGNKTITFKE